MKPKSKSEKIAVLFGTWFYTGLIPPPRFLKGAAGTYGSFFALPICFAYIYVSRLLFMESILLTETVVFQTGFLYSMVLFGVVTSNITERVLGPMTDWRGRTKTRDQNQIVIDEVIGMMIACLPVAYTNINLFSWPMLVLIGISFLSFRMFDILKIWPANLFDRRHDSWGIIMDDVVAGIQAAIIQLIGIYLFF